MLQAQHKVPNKVQAPLGFNSTFSIKCSCFVSLKFVALNEYDYNV